LLGEKVSGDESKFSRFCFTSAGLAVHRGRDGVKEKDVQGSTPAVSLSKGVQGLVQLCAGQIKRKMEEWENETDA
jgi:hypothetical protein